MTGPQDYVFKDKRSVGKFVKNPDRHFFHLYIGIEALVDNFHYMILQFLPIKLHHHHSDDGEQEQDDQCECQKILEYDPQLLFHLYLRNVLKSCLLSSSVGFSW